MLQFYHNLPFVCKSSYHAARINVSRNAFFSSRSEKQNRVKTNQNVVSWSVLLSTMGTLHYSFPKQCFLIAFCMLSEFEKVFERKADAYKQLICIMQRVHFQVAVGVFNCQQILTKISFVILILWYKTNRIWLSVVCIPIDNDTGHHSGQNLL